MIGRKKEPAAPKSPKEIVQQGVDAAFENATGAAESMRLQLYKMFLLGVKTGQAASAAEMKVILNNSRGSVDQAVTNASAGFIGMCDDALKRCEMEQLPPLEEILKPSERSGPNPTERNQGVGVQFKDDKSGTRADEIDKLVKINQEGEKRAANG